MGPSQKQLSAGIALVLMLVVAAEMGQVQADTCWTRSNNFHAFCISSKPCDKVCRAENPNYTGGECRGIQFNCYCSSPCKPAAAAEPAAAPVA
ncbi:hypothetical protein ACP4OV_002861 [Aristida adscensionis]